MENSPKNAKNDNQSEVSVDRIRIGFGSLFLKKLNQDQDICLISITKFP